MLNDVKINFNAMLFQSSGRFLYNTIQSSSSFILYEKLPFVVEMVFVYRVKTSINFSIKMLLNIHMMVSYTNNLWFVIERRNGRAEKKFKVFYLGFHTWLNFFEYLYIVKQYMIIFHNYLYMILLNNIKLSTESEYYYTAS